MTEGTAVTIGAYDGVHLGHQRVIEEVCRLACAEDLESVVVTFDRHPASVVRPESAPLQLTDLTQRLELLQASGVDRVHLIEFTRERAHESAEKFVDEVLVGELATRIVVVGRDFHFGRNRAGNVALLEEMGTSRGFRVVPFDLVDDHSGDGPVSSTRIRKLIAQGEMSMAAELLGRPHEVRGVVVGPVGGEGGPDADGASCHLQVASQIMLPPPGTYDLQVGLVGPQSSAIYDSHGVIGTSLQGDSFVPVELQAVPVVLAEGAVARVLFSH
jgi:riboflavin kinase/FMN adenylyltransferase